VVVEGGEAYMKYVAAAKPAGNPAVGGTQRKKGHFWMDTIGDPG
jgi:hypothetical protein